MCISFIYSNENAPEGSYKLIIASNRDEVFYRETKSLHCWPNRNVIGGQDAVKGGTWLAASKNGKIGILLNVLGENSRTNGKDRGPIVVKYLESNLNAEEYLNNLKQDTESCVYNGFHVVLLELSNLTTNIYHFSNMLPFSSNETLITKISENKNGVSYVYGFGNSQSIEQPFRKVKEGKEIFEEIINQYNKKDKTECLIENILKHMQNKQSHYPDVEIDRKAEDFMDENYKMKYSAVCVNMPDIKYGTRTHSILLIDQNNVLDFHEWTLEDYQTQCWKHSHIQQKLDFETE